jgi:hypothetical protein
VLDVVRLALPEHRLQQRISENLRIEDLFEPVQAGVPAGVLIQRRHGTDHTGRLAAGPPPPRGLGRECRPDSRGGGLTGDLEGRDAAHGAAEDEAALE